MPDSCLPHKSMKPEVDSLPRLLSSPLRLCWLLDLFFIAHELQVQDSILEKALATETPGALESPWVVFTAGAMVRPTRTLQP